MNCPKCHAPLDDLAESCEKCGAKIQEEKKPKKDKPEQKAKKTEPEQVSKKVESTPAPTEPAPEKEEKKPAKPNKKSGKNTKLWIIIAVLGVLIVILGIVALYVIFRSDDDGSGAKDKFDQLANATVNQNANTNLNTNTSVNSNKNQNANTNVNTNTNTNANKNTNTNSNANQNANTNVNTNTNQNTNTNAPVQDAVNPVRPDKGQTTVTASSTLLDTTSIGFDYSPSTAIDQDFSTAWTEDVDDEGVGEWVTLDFPTTAKINTVGIVPGYGRETDIYYKNNRIKELELGFSDGTTVTETLIDDYNMQFIEFTTRETDYLKLTVKSVYAGSTYDDTCVAELDIWSDYVLNKDATAAMNYYLTYKEPYAVRPPEATSGDYISRAYMAIGIMGTPTPEIEVGSYSPAMEPMIAAAEIPATTPAGQTFTAKWYSNTGQLFKTQDITSYSAFAGLDTITISSTANISDLLDPPNVLWQTGDYKVEWYENGSLSTTVNFPVNAQ